MKIDFLCNDGSPLKVTMDSLWGKDDRTGIGGSELAMLTLCDEWQKKGYEVRLYNDPSTQSVSAFEQLPIAAFDPDEDRDVLIIFRTPRFDVVGAKGLKVWLSFDQFTLSDRPFGRFAPIPDKIVVISDYHAEYLEDTYEIENTIVIDLPVRTYDFDEINETKIKNRLIYTSVPDRGLMNLHALWPLIKVEIPDASLMITSDYRLWGLGHANNARYFAHWIGVEDVQFKGAMRRMEYLNEICKADLFVYPHKAVNPELFCVSCAEAQYAGAYPITSAEGALSTTNMGTILKGDPESVRWRIECVDAVVEMLSDRKALSSRQKQIRKLAYQRFNPENVLKQWDEKVFN